MVSSASAVPLLSMGSNANYQFNASIQSSQSCSASFPPSAQINYTQLACGPYRPMTLVEIVDNGTCTQAQAGFSCFYNSPYYYPTYISIGTTVMWFNRGSLLHTATSVSNPPSFNSGALAHDASYLFTFTSAGIYNYSDTFHPWLHGAVIVSSYQPIPTPIASSFTPTISFAGSLNWTVNGLDNSVAVLTVSHQVSTIVSASGFSFTPVTETGSFPQSINLSTRVESPGDSHVSDLEHRSKNACISGILRLLRLWLWLFSSVEPVALGPKGGLHILMGERSASQWPTGGDSDGLLQCLRKRDGKPWTRQQP